MILIIMIAIILSFFYRTKKFVKYFYRKPTRILINRGLEFLNKNQ